MPTPARWPKSGRSPRIPWSGYGYLHGILPRRPVARTYGSYLGGGLRQNKGGFLVRDDLPLLTPSAPTVAAPPPGWTSPSGSCPQTS